MATFARSTFDAAAYLAHRPTYPRWLYERVLRFHAEGPAPKWQRAVDLGCGPGISTLQIVPHFKDTVGVDPSERMVAAAARPAQFSALPDELRPVPQPGKTLGSVDYRQGNAEELPFIENESVDLVTAGQAAHWFDYPKLWTELSRIVRPGGTVAFWGYAEFFLPDYPTLRPMISEYSNGRDSLGPYWEQPGRSIVEQMLVDIPWPFDSAAQLPSSLSTQWDATSATRAFLSLSGSSASSAFSASSPDAEVMDKHLTWDSFGGYLRTWSSLHTYLSSHPDDANAPGAEGKDIAARFRERLRAAAREVDEQRERSASENVTLRWPVGMMMLRKKA